VGLSAVPLEAVPLDCVPELVVDVPEDVVVVAVPLLTVDEVVVTAVEVQG
jgi:hypothetical protein